MLAGDIYFQVENHEVLLEPGTLALINPETLHSCNSQSSKKRSFYMLHLRKEWCLKVQQSLWNNPRFVPVDTVLLRDMELYQEYLNIMKCVPNPYHSMEMEQRLAHFSTSVFARCCYPTIPVETKDKGVIELKKWLESRLEDDLTLEEYCHDKGINPYTLLRHFRKSIGITPHAYRTNCRIEKARKLLQQGVDIVDVALRTGFFDQSHLHRHFVALTSVTPRQYQLQFLHR